MRFAVFALLASASAVRLGQEPRHLVKLQHKVGSNVQKFMKTKLREEPELNSEDEAEIEAWVEHELTTGDKTITKKEAAGAIKAFAKKKGYKLTKEDWKALEAAFDAVDTNKDGELDLDEVMAAVKAEADIKIPKSFFKKYIKEGPPELDSEDEAEIEAWVTHELTTGDKTITKKEAAGAIKAFAKKKGYKITKEDWAALEAAFDAADTNHDGELDLSEVQAAVEAEADIKIPKKFFKKFMKEGPPELDSEDEAEIEAWVTHELTTGDKTITKKEAAGAIKKFAKKHGYKLTKDDWEALEAAFDAADTNHDGELDLAEVQAAVEAHSDIKLPYKQMFKKFLKTKDEPEMSEGEEDEVKAWAEAELADGGTITGEEAVDFFGKYAKKHGYKMTPMDWGYLGYMFGQADTNSDGELDAAEVQAAMAEDS